MFVLDYEPLVLAFSRHLLYEFLSIVARNNFILFVVDKYRRCATGVSCTFEVELKWTKRMLNQALLEEIH
jgi:hypothetical protein